MSPGILAGTPASPISQTGDAPRTAWDALHALDCDISLHITHVRELAGVISDCSSVDEINVDRINALGDAIVRLADLVHEVLHQHTLAAREVQHG